MSSEQTHKQLPDLTRHQLPSWSQSRERGHKAETHVCWSLKAKQVTWAQFTKKTAKVSGRILTTNISTGDNALFKCLMQANIRINCII